MELFHFLRPWMLLLLLPWCALIVFEIRARRVRSSWQNVIDSHLLTFQLGEQQRNARRFGVFLTALASLLIIIALAGPAWEQRPLPVFRDQLARVIVLDVSRSMDAGDIEPSRIARARFKVRDLLERSVGIQVGLIAFGAAPYVISPLTDDTRTINAMIPSLSTSIVPVQGSELGAALREAERLMRGAGVKRGEIIAVTDATPSDDELRTAAELRANGYTVSVLAVGSEEGAPIPNGGSFLKNPDGSIIVPTLATGELQQLAVSGGGQFTTLTVDDADINTLMLSGERQASSERRVADNKTADSWIERGPWLLLPLIPFFALLFRRGAM